MVGSIAAGNCTVLKPSEISEHSSNLVGKMIADTFEPNYIAAVEGGIDVSKRLLEEEFDYIFYTGGTAVGKIVMSAAAKHLTPVTMELGGKNPCIIDSEIRVKYVAQRIVFGKFLNAGQICLAPDYLLVHSSIKSQFLEEIVRAIRKFYGSDPSSSRDYGRIINKQHFARLSSLLKEGNIVIGGDLNEDELYIAPTVIDNLSSDTKVMQEEVFGPILPVLSYDDLDEAISMVNSMPKPLALYFFSQDSTKQERIMRETSSGGITFNSLFMHGSTSTLPFGGVGDSGMGAYHGKASFDTYTHYKGVLYLRLPMDFWLHPPYPRFLESELTKGLFQRLLRVRGRG
jgi:acyl-CoA reductase-like NAD-dependent aldehyde dehydrogenase